MVTLEDAKAYLKVDEDITEEDTLIESLIEAAEQYVEQSTGKQNTGGLYDLCVKLLVAHWFENRAAFSPKPGTISELPHSVTALMQHIAMASVYPELERAGE